MRLVHLAILFLIHYALSSLVFVGLFLGASWCKGRQLRFRSEAWDDFFLTFPAEKAERLFLWLYLAADVLAGCVDYMLLRAGGFVWALPLAISFFLVWTAFFAWKWQRKGGKFISRYQAMVDDIRRRREEQHKPCPAPQAVKKVPSSRHMRMDGT